MMVQLSLTAGEEVEIEYEVDGWFYVRTSYFTCTKIVVIYSLFPPLS